jgi:hypothetical protein
VKLLLLSIVILAVVTAICCAIDWEDRLGHYGGMFGLMIFVATAAILFWVNAIAWLWRHF